LDIYKYKTQGADTMINYYNIFLDTKETLSLNAYLVGGSIRDMLLDRPIKDYDIVVDKNPMGYAEAITRQLNGRLVPLDEDREIYRIVLKSKEVIDISPIKGSTIEEDLSNRDFTINAMAYDISEGLPIKRDRIIDPFEGKLDIERKIIRSIRDGCFRDDPIRLVRAVRFMAQLGYEIHGDTLDQVKEDANQLHRVSGERIAAELFIILNSPKSYYYIGLMDKELGLLDKLFPEIEDMKLVGECRYHVVNSWTHSIYTVKIAENVINDNNFYEKHIKKAFEKHTKEFIASDRSRLQLIKLGALFHDIGKPLSIKIDNTGRTRFRGHEITGAEKIKSYAENLRLSTKEKVIMQKYVALHMLPLVLYKSNDVSGNALYNVFKQMGDETLDILLIAYADIVATRRLLDPHEEMGMFKIHIEYIANNYLTRFKPLEDISSIITGIELMDILNLQEGQAVGEAIEEIRKAIYLGKIPATKEAAREYIKSEKKNQ